MATMRSLLRAIDEREQRIKDLAADNARLRADLERMVRVQQVPAMTVGPWSALEAEGRWYESS